MVETDAAARTLDSILKHKNGGEAVGVSQLVKEMTHGFQRSAIPHTHSW